MLTKSTVTPIITHQPHKFHLRQMNSEISYINIIMTEKEQMIKEANEYLDSILTHSITESDKPKI